MQSVFVIKLCLNSKQVAKGQRSMPESQLVQSLAGHSRMGILPYTGMVAILGM